MSKLGMFSEAVTDGLREGIAGHLGRYRGGGFQDMVNDSGWDIRLGIEVDLEPLKSLDPSGKPEAEIANSRSVWSALGMLRSSVACDERIWTRLAHIECFEFSRMRWLDGADPDDHEKLVRDHFFADGLTRKRDDNAISRLWWNAYIANRIEPDSNLRPLDTILSKADIRASLVERSRTASRAPLAAGIIRSMNRNPWVTEAEANFRKLMRVLNLDGGGMLFECLPPDTIDSFMDRCIGRARLLDTE